MVNFDRIGKVLSLRADGIVPVRFFCSCRALLNHVRVTKSALIGIESPFSSNMALTCFALGIAVEPEVFFHDVVPLLTEPSSHVGIEVPHLHPSTSLMFLLDSSVTSDVRRKYAEPILNGFSLGYYDIPENLMGELIESCNDTVCQSLEFLYHLIVNRHFVRATLALEHASLTPLGLTLMHLCARDGDVTALGWCFDNGCDINAIERKGWSPLSYAVYGGHPSAVSFLLQKNARTDLIDTAGNSMLQLACMSGSLDVVSHLSLMQNFEDWKRGNNEGMSCLHISVKYCHWKIVEWCLEKGVDPNQSDSKGLSPLHYAAAADSALSIVALHLRGARYPSLSYDVESPLLIAVRNRRVDVLNKLIELYDLRPEIRSVFEHAISLQYSEMIEALMCSCREVSDLWNRPDHLLFEAVSCTNHLLLRVLLRCHTLTDNMLLVSLVTCLSRNEWVTVNDIIAEYKDRKYNVESLVSAIQNSSVDLQSVVRIALKNSYLPLLEGVLDCGFPVNGRLIMEDAPAMLPAQNESCRLSEMWISVDGDVLDISYDNQTLLSYASFFGFSSCVAMLLRRGADVDLATEMGLSPLMLASYKGHLYCIELLLRSGANVNFVDQNGMTALMYASSENHSSCVEVLMKGGAIMKYSKSGGMTGMLIISVVMLIIFGVVFVVLGVLF